ncbi:hypothetical protein EI171_08315 [Bradyrhizobium sp. LCT2]|uniref:type IV secretory system conjugative DNA transfer family protein n=1 Tax=Bradyrhizobium sp. LCT2 TaxID=2493093 RepID=UPI0013741D00|nr:hypothetical protein [Bradyrhizobium sp. LCT2]QHP67431.1 hypothetical protein EI171_08315 [Bradyrhizobium sp. LCT2]
MSEARFSGHWIVAGQGLGKSNLLLHMISEDIPTDASVIVVDPKGDLTNSIRNLALGNLLVTLDPTFVPFAINPLDVPKTDTKRAVDQIEYIFGAILGTGITPKQQALLRSLLRACILCIPNATLLTVQDLLIRGPESQRSHFQSLPPDLQYLFDTSKNGGWSTYDSTRNELNWRVQLLLEIDIIRTMFSAPKTRFNIAESMDDGDIVLIDNSWDKLHIEGSKFLGRYIMAQIWAAATARSSRPRHEKRPVYVYVDEADTIIDSTVAEIIFRCRSQNIGLILAHQSSSQIKDPAVLSALESCAIKMVNVDAEAKYFSKLLHIPEERMNMLPRGQFAMHVRGEQPEIVEIPHAESPLRAMSPGERHEHRERMQLLYGVEPQELPSEAPSRPATEPTEIVQSTTTDKPRSVSKPIPSEPPTDEDNKPSPWGR